MKNKGLIDLIMIGNIKRAFEKLPDNTTGFTGINTKPLENYPFDRVGSRAEKIVSKLTRSTELLEQTFNDINEYYYAFAQKESITYKDMSDMVYVIEHVLAEHDNIFALEWAYETLKKSLQAYKAILDNETGLDLTNVIERIQLLSDSYNSYVKVALKDTK